MKPVPASDVIKKIEELGLQLNLQTGGTFDPTYTKLKPSRKFLTHYQLTTFQNQKISVLDPGLFLKSIIETENSLQLKLFS